MGKRAQQAKKNPGEFFQVLARMVWRPSETVESRNGVQGRTASSVIGTKNQKGWMCWNTGVR